MARLDDVSVDALRAELEAFDGHRPMERLLAAIAYKGGPSVPQIADWLEVRPATVYAWFDRIEAADDLGSAVRDRPRSGRPARLTDAEREAFFERISRPPSAVGFDAEAWTVDLARAFLADAYGVEYSSRHVRRLLGAARSDEQRGPSPVD